MRLWIANCGFAIATATLPPAVATRRVRRNPKSAIRNPKSVARPLDLVQVASALRSGQLITSHPRGLRAGAVLLRPGAMMDWHSTRRREELLIVLSGPVTLQLADSAAATIRRLVLKAGQCAWLKPNTRHRVVNGSSQQVRYVYVTAPAA